MKNQIPVIVQNNTPLKQRVTLFDRFSDNSPNKPLQQYTFNVTGLAIGPKVSIEMDNGSGYNGYCATLATQDAAGLVAALTSLGFGRFFTFQNGGQTYVAVQSSRFVFRRLSVTATFTFTMDNTAAAPYDGIATEVWVEQSGASSDIAIGFFANGVNGDNQGSFFPAQAIQQVGGLSRAGAVELTQTEVVNPALVTKLFLTTDGAHPWISAVGGLANLPACVDFRINGGYGGYMGYNSGPGGSKLTAIPVLPPAVQIVRLAAGAISAFTAGSLPATVKDLDLDGNALPVAAVNQILQDLAAGAVSNGTVKLRQTVAAAPSGAGAAAKATLIGRGWTVLTD